MDHLRNEIQILISVLVSTPFGRTNDRNSTTVYIPIPGEAVPAGKLLQLPKGSCLHVTNYSGVDYLLRAHFALQIGLALEGRREAFITAIPERDIAYLMKVVVEDIDGFSGFEGSCDGIS